MKPQMANWVRMTKLSRLMAVVTFVSLAGMLACSDDNNSGSSADEPSVLTHQLTRSFDTPDLSPGPVLNPEEEILWEMNFVKQVIEPDAGTTLFFPDYDSEKLYGDEGHRMNVGGEVDDRWRGVEEVQSFLESHWDEYWEGVEDPGWNSQELVDYLMASGLAHDLLLEHFEESGAQDLTEFLDFVNNAANQTEVSVRDVVHFFEQTQIPYSAVIHQLAAAGVTEDEVWAAMLQAGHDFTDLANLYLGMDERDLSVAFGTLVNGPPLVLVAMADPPSAQYSKVALDAAKFIYQMIKDNAPQSAIDASSSIKVLNDQDMNWAHYFSIAPEPTPGSFHYTMKTGGILVTSGFDEPHNLVDVSWQTKAVRSQSSLRVAPAYYIPSLYPVFQVNHVDWGGNKVASTYKIARPSNVASSLINPVNACLPYIVTNHLTTYFTTHTGTWDRVANARFGIDQEKCWTSPYD